MRVEFKGKLDNLSITATETLNSIINLKLMSLVPKVVVRVFKNLGEFYNVTRFNFLCFQFFYVAKERTV